MEQPILPHAPDLRRRKQRRLIAAGVVGLLVMTLCAGCGIDRDRYRWERALLVADRLADHQELAQARDAYTTLAETAPTPEFERYIAYRLALLLELEGDHGAAIRAYEPLWNAGIKDEHASNALFRTAMIYYERLGRTEEGLEVFDRILGAMPDSTAAKKALLEILGHHERAGDREGALDYVTRRYELLGPTAIGDNLLFARARLYRELGQQQEAIETYAAVMRDHASSGLRDDAHWEMAELLEELGRYDDALIQLRFITEDRDDSWYVGSYDSQYVDEARFRRGLIYLERLQKWGDAEAEFSLFVEEFQESLLRDDARWNIVQARLGAGEGEGAEDACEALADAEPESRWVDDCQRLIASLHQGADPRTLRTRAAD